MTQTIPVYLTISKSQCHQKIKSECELPYAKKNFRSQNETPTNKHNRSSKNPLTKYM